jgi:hypothetical protein
MGRPPGGDDVGAKWKTSFRFRPMGEARQVSAGFRSARRRTRTSTSICRRQYFFGAALPRKALDDPSTLPISCNPEARQLAAGYALYGPSTMLVLTVGNGTHGFTLDRDIGEFLLTHPICAFRRKRVASPSTRPTNASGSRRSAATSTNAWPAKRRSWQGFQHALGGVDGRRCASHPDARRRFHVPARHQGSEKTGWLNMLHQANPMAMIVEQAGGLASTGYERIADVADRTASASAGDPRIARRSRAH